MRAILLTGLVAVIVGGSMLLARQVKHVAANDPIGGNNVLVPCGFGEIGPDTIGRVAEPRTLRLPASRTISDSSHETDWLQVGLLLGRVDEAARRDVAPSVLATQLREVATLLAREPAAVRHLMQRLAADVASTASPEVARSRLATALAELRQTEQMAEATLEAFVAGMAWDGTWETTYGTMVLTMGGDGAVSGSYGTAEYAIVGKVDSSNPSVLEGTWQEGSSDGRFRFRLKDAGQWEGHWTSGDAEPGDRVNWTATRAADAGALSHWIGEWETSYGTMTLSRGEGARTLEGWYGSPTKRVVGWCDPSEPDVLVGYWYYENSTSSGRIEFRLTNGQTWNGGWSSGMAPPSPGSWSGKRPQRGDEGGELMETVGPGEAAEGGSVPAGDFGLFLGEE